MVYHGDDLPQNKDLTGAQVTMEDQIAKLDLPGEMEEEEQQQSFAESYSQDEREE